MTIFFENPIIFIILVAVISALFRKKKENGDPEGPKRSNTNLWITDLHRQQNLRFEEVREVFKELHVPFPASSIFRFEKGNPYYEEKKVERETMNRLCRAE